jgi:hypothetical protein
VIIVERFASAYWVLVQSRGQWTIQEMPDSTCTARSMVSRIRAWSRNHVRRSRYTPTASSHVRRYWAIPKVHQHLVISQADRVRSSSSSRFHGWPLEKDSVKGIDTSDSLLSASPNLLTRGVIFGGNRVGEFLLPPESTPSYFLSSTSLLYAPLAACKHALCGGSRSVHSSELCPPFAESIYLPLVLIRKQCVELHTRLSRGLRATS